VKKMQVLDGFGDVSANSMASNTRQARRERIEYGARVTADS